MSIKKTVIHLSRINSLRRNMRLVCIRDSLMEKIYQMEKRTMIWIKRAKKMKIMRNKERERFIFLQYCSVKYYSLLEPNLRSCRNKMKSNSRPF